MKILALIFLFFSINYSFAQGIKVDSISDIMGNQYIFSNSKVQKISSNKTFNYDNLFNGNISYIDVSNPFRILLFYKDFNKVVFLDDKLSEQETLSFDFKVNNICWKSGGNILIYNFSESYFAVFDYKNKKIINSVSFIVENKPVLLFEQNKEIVLVTLNYIYVFDEFINFKLKINARTSNYSIKKGNLFLYNSLGEQILLK